LKTPLKEREREAKLRREREQARADENLAIQLVGTWRQPKEQVVTPSKKTGEAPDNALGSVSENCRSSTRMRQRSL